MKPELLRGETVHARSGSTRHRFRYSVDYVMLDPASREGPRLFSRNRFNLASVHDRDHGGPRGAGRGVAWFHDVLAERGFDPARLTGARLLTQPACLGFEFNPVSFWLAFEGDDLRAVVAEVNNTFGDRHCYFCALPDFAPIGPQDRIQADKVFHVSPFRDIEGQYTFGFSIAGDHVSILIRHTAAQGEVMHATLTGRRSPLTNTALLHGMLLRRPLGALRVLVLIYRQAIALRLRGLRYRRRPLPPSEELS